MLLQSKYEETIKECTKALELNPTYAKALFRRAQAHEKLQHFEEAVTGEYMMNLDRIVSFFWLLYRFNGLSFFLFSRMQDLKKMLELDPSNDQARKGIRRLEPLAKEEYMCKF